MSDRFPALRPQATLSLKSSPDKKALSTPAAVDLSFLAALVFLVALALI